MSVVEISATNDLVKTSRFPYAKFPFEFFNPVQSSIFDYCEEDANFLIASGTSSGKTAVSEMFISHCVRSTGKKGIFLVPLKALAQEKITDWTNENYHFSDLKVSVVTGDYRLTPNRIKELNSADVIVMTLEMLNSKARNFKSDKCDFLSNVGVLCVDEAHVIGEKGRGDHLENGLMKFTSFNPQSKIVFLSGTLPNYKEVGEWMSYLNNKKTYVIDSKHRPCPLQLHFIKYFDKGPYDKVEKNKIFEALKIVEKHRNDKFLIFVHSKRTGNDMVNALQMNGFVCEFHNGDLSKEKRVAIEERFRSDKKMQILVATSTLEAGINAPARRVIITGVHRGLEAISPRSLQQQAGRAGRPKYDTQGDAYFLLPMSEFDEYKQYVQSQQHVESQLSEAKNLAFHVTNEIYQGDAEDKESIGRWHDRSLSAYQNNTLDKDLMDSVVEKLRKCGAIYENDGKISSTAIGKVASLFYFSPFDVSDLNRNFKFLFDRQNHGDDVLLSVALANIDSNRSAIANSVEKEEMVKFKQKVSKVSNYEYMDGVLKYACAYYNLLTGTHSIPLGSLMRTLQQDFERVRDVLIALDGMVAEGDNALFFKTLEMRIRYGVPEEMIDLCRVEGIGSVRAKRLYEAGIKTLQDLSSDVVKIVKALNCSKKVADVYVERAKDLLSAK